MSGLDYRSIIISYIRFKLVSACNLRIYKEFIYSFNIFCASTAIIPKPLLHKGNLKILILRLHPRPELGFLGLGSGNSGTSLVFFFFFYPQVFLMCGPSQKPLLYYVMDLLKHALRGYMFLFLIAIVNNYLFIWLH